MLGEMRRHSKSAIIYFLFAIIIIVFVFTFNTGAGMGGGGCSGTETPSFAEVAGQELTRDSMITGMRMLPTIMSSNEGFGVLMGMGVDMMSLYSADPDRLGPEQARAALDTLVGLALVAREAERLGLEVSDRDLAKALYPDQFFKKDEANPEAEPVFDWTSYNNWVSYYLRSSQTAYEDYVRSTLQARMAYNYVGGLVAVSDAEAKIAALAKMRKVNAEVAEFYPDSFDAGVTVPADLTAYTETKKEEIDAYYDANPTEFHTAEQIKVRVAYGSGLSTMPSPTDVTSAPLKDSDYEKLAENAGELLKRLNGEMPLYPEEKPAAAEGEAPAEGAAAEAKPEEAKPAREEPKDKSERFAELAKYWSADPATKDRGGLIPDWFGADQLAAYPFGPDIADAVAKANKGDVVGPLKGVTGYWLIMVEDKRAPRDLTLEQARPEIAGKLYRKEKAPEAARTQAKAFLEAATKASDKSLEALLDDYKELKDSGAIRVRKTGMFDAGKRGFSVPTVGSSEEIFKELFTSGKVGTVGSKVFELESGRILVYRCLEVENPQGDPSAEDLAKAADDLKRDKRTAAFQAWFAALKKTAEDNGDIEFTTDWTDFLAALKTAQDQAAADKAKSEGK